MLGESIAHTGLGMEIEMGDVDPRAYFQGPSPLFIVNDDSTVMIILTRGLTTRVLQYRAPMA